MVEHAGTTFDRGRIARTAEEIQRRAASRRDLIADTRTLEAIVHEERTGPVSDLGTRDGQYKRSVRVLMQGQENALPTSRTADSQIAAREGIPQKYYNRMATEAPELLAHNVNHWWKQTPSRNLVRMLDGRVRAFLSDRYRILDSADLFFAAAEEFEALNQDGRGIEVWDARLSDDHFHLFAVAGRVSSLITEGRTFDPGDGWMSHWANLPGDANFAALRISNSETGQGGLNVRPAILTRVCANFCVWQEGVSKIHLGRKQEEEGFLTPETLAAEDRVVWLKVRDIIRTTFNPLVFQELADKMRGALADRIEKPAEAVDAVVAKYQIPEARRDAILTRFAGFGDLSRHGLAQAVTFQAHDDGLSVEEKAMYEETGGMIFAGSLRSLVGA